VKKGVTLLELVVSMAIFLVVMTIAVGAFVAVSRMKGLTSTMKESQQKTRIVMEMVTRLARQADKVIVSSDGKDMQLYFGTKNPATANGVRLFITSSGVLNYYECPIHSVNCINWGTADELYKGITLQNTSRFTKNGTIPPTLNVELYGKIGGVGTSPYYSDEINLNTTIILESIK
jgi:prepilin-type N-terminal cleavage/methylation domain-containing protein